METSVNNKCRAFTSLEQSRKLAEILPLESADMTYMPIMDIDSMSNAGFLDIPQCYSFNEYSKNCNVKPLPCWSLAALLEIIPRNLKIVLAVNDYWDGNVVKYKYAIGSVEHDNYDCYADNHVDACYELIIKLHELNLL